MQKYTHLLFAVILAMNCLTGFSQNSYFVSTIEEKVETDSLGNVIQQDDSNLSEEERFLNANFPTMTLCDWTEGMRFMVIPGKKDEYLRTFTDSITRTEVSTGSLKHKILVYKGHETTSRGWEHLNFYCEDNKKSYYVELRNMSFADYCHKTENGGVRALAYLGDVDKARELLIGKELYTRGDMFYIDDKSAADGCREVPLKEDSHVRVEQVGVGSRDFPVKIVVRADNGELYFQEVAMSRINCTLVNDDFYRENARHLFSNSFGFSSKNGKKSATMSAQFVNKKINSRQSVKVKNKDGVDQNFPKNTIFLVKDVKSDPGTDYYIMTLGNRGNDYTIHVTFQNKDVSGNIDGKQEAYFYELFSIGEEFHANNSTITHNVTVSGGFAGMVSGIVSKGMTMQQVRMAKGNPEKKWKNKNGTTSWKYLDGTYTFNSKGVVITVTHTETY